ILAWIAVGPGLRSVATKRIGAHVSRATIGLGGMVTSFAALQLLPLAEATTLQFTVPIFATITAALLLREPTGWHRWGAVLVGFAGVLIAVIVILLRTIGRTESASTTVFWFSALSVAPLGILYLLHLQAHDPVTW